MLNYEGEYMFWGPPGCGKTSMLTRQVKKILETSPRQMKKGCPVTICSLTRTAASEIAGRAAEDVPPGQIGTLHSHAYRALGAPQIAEIGPNLKKWNEAFPQYRMALGVSDSDEPIESYRRSVGEKLYSAHSVLRAKRTPRDRWPDAVALFDQAWQRWKDDEELIDFTEMIERAIEEVDRAPGDPDVLMADEVQDLSALEFELLRKWGDAAGALIMAGDAYQALYTWRGADPSIFVDGSIPDDRIKVLSQSYRVPGAVHAMAMRWVRQLSDFREIEYRPREEDGYVRRLRGATWRNPDAAIARAAEVVDEGGSAMLMTTCSYMLESITRMLRREGVPFANPWRRKRGDWNPLGRRSDGSTLSRLTGFLRPDGQTWGDRSRMWTVHEFRLWAEIIESKGNLLHGAKTALEEFDQDDEGSAIDREIMVSELLEFVEEDALTEVMDATAAGTEAMASWIQEKILGRRKRAAAYPLQVARRRGGSALLEEPRLHVGTIHSFKGAEADVVILFPDLSPSAGKELKGTPKQRDNIIRALYVALTRARVGVEICDPHSPDRVDLTPFMHGGTS